MTATGGWPAGAAPEDEEPEILLVPLTRPRTPRGAAAAGLSTPEAFDADGDDALDRDASDRDASADVLHPEPLEAAPPAGEETAADPFSS